MKIEFGEKDWHYTGDFATIVLYASVEGREITCVISPEALKEFFDATDHPMDMRVAFIRNRPTFEALAREMIENGRIEIRHYVFMERQDIVEFLERNNITPVPSPSVRAVRSAGTWPLRGSRSDALAHVISRGSRRYRAASARRPAGRRSGA